jgi:hypothetical protein
MLLRFHFSRLTGHREICEATFHARELMEFNKTMPSRRQKSDWSVVTRALFIRNSYESVKPFYQNNSETRSTS